MCRRGFIRMNPVELSGLGDREEVCFPVGFKFSQQASYQFVTYGHLVTASCQMTVYTQILTVS